MGVLEALHMSYASTTMTLDWQSRRNTICKLYLNDRRTLHDVNEVMKAHHNFRARFASSSLMICLPPSKLQ
jgi:hypothetical protein